MAFQCLSALIISVLLVQHTSCIIYCGDLTVSTGPCALDITAATGSWTSHPTPYPTIEPTPKPTEQRIKPPQCANLGESCTTDSKSNRCCGTVKCHIPYHASADASANLIGKCCIKPRASGCVVDSDCCMTPDVCINSICARTHRNVRMNAFSAQSIANKNAIRIRAKPNVGDEMGSFFKSGSFMVLMILILLMVTMITCIYMFCHSCCHNMKWCWNTLLNKFAHCASDDTSDSEYMV
eukprot:342090_1